MAGRTFSSLGIPNYRTYFFGLLASNLGGWMASTAKQWLVLTMLTHGDSRALGNLTGLMFLPALLCVPISANIADRLSKRKIMLVAQAFQACTAALLATLVLTGHVQLWHVFVLAFVDGTAQALAQPAQQAFVSELVRRDQLANAISLNSASFNGTRLLGPGIAGALIALVDTGPVLALNVIAFLSMIVALVKLDPDDMTIAPPVKSKGQLREGLRYIGHRPDLMLLLFIAFMMGNFGFNFAISNAVMATQAFGKGAAAYGSLGSIMGIGALSASLLSARRPVPRIRHVLSALLLFVVMSTISALAPNYWVFAFTLIPIGLSAIMTNLTCNQIVQMNVAQEFRGRVMSVWGAVLVGGTPLVSPVVGWLGRAAGPRSTVWFECGSIALCLGIVMAYFYSHERIRLRLERGERAPRLVVERGLTEDIQPVAK